MPCCALSTQPLSSQRRRNLGCRVLQGPAAAPSLSDNEEDAGASQPSTSGRGPPPPPPSGPSPARQLWRRTLRQLSSLKLALAELAVVATLSSVGTVIKQGEPYAYYAENYPEEGKKVLGFLTGRIIWALQWDHIYSADYFLGLLALLGASLAACTATNQWPAVKVARRWRFKTEEASLARLQVGARLPNASLRDVAAALVAKQYRVFVKDGQLYGFKGLSGKLGPIGVHASMLLCMAGFAIGALGGFTGSVMIPEGGDTVVASALRSASPLAWVPGGAEAVLHCDDFRIDYRADGSIRQFYSDVSVRDLDGRVLQSKTMSVNQPLRFGGVTAYQTDWSMSALQLTVAGSQGGIPDGTTIQLPMANLQGGDNKLYATFLPAEDPSTVTPGAAPRGVSVLARDLQAVTFYDSKGEFAGVRRLGSGKSIEVEGLTLTPRAIIASTGLELKADPGVPLVYAGFGGLCVTTVVSYLSHSQVWAAQAGSGVLVGGTTNRAKVAFEAELGEVLAGVPELPAAPDLVDGGSNGSSGGAAAAEQQRPEGQ
ncbi:cytochrome c biogenesis [Micractinium conductrix]|uniref:Cytochrome c biogenesis n=1 Tax=Micractinium conductrix TaxID=554055 RepID=A0A2P6V205_9CHLO|nr:cytochrome c biogenesis [Micractinium conductrix]|eukprot:PSC68118.1 cytochrome c biogenesis [Micractinium conductrix]